MRYIKNIVLIVTLVVVLSVTGIVMLNAQKDIGNFSNSGYMTDFDYIIKSPSAKQIESFKENAAVDKIVPCYNQRFNKDNQSISLLLTPDMANIDIGFFNDKNLIDGQFNENGLMIDENVAKLYNVKVGDELNIQLGKSTFNYKISAIYLPTSYTNFETGVMLAKYTDAIESAYSSKLVYSLAFIKAKDLEACGSMLNDYHPEAVLMSQQEYVGTYKKNNLCPPNITEEEWTNSIIAAYDEYVANFYNRKDKDAVQAKSDYLVEVDDIVKNRQKKVTTTVIGVAIGSVILYILAGIVFTFINKEDIIDRYRDGEPLIVIKESLLHVFSVALIAVLSYVIMKIATMSLFQFEAFVPIMCALSFSIIASLVVVLPINISLTRNAVTIDKRNVVNMSASNNSKDSIIDQMKLYKESNTKERSIKYPIRYRSEVNPSIIVKEYQDRFEVYKEDQYGLRHIDTKEKH